MKDVFKLPSSAYYVKIGGEELIFSAELGQKYLTLMGGVMRTDPKTGISKKVYPEYCIDPATGAKYRTDAQMIIPIKLLQNQKHLELGHKMCTNGDWHYMEVKDGDTWSYYCKQGGCTLLSAEEAFQVIQGNTTYLTPPKTVLLTAGKQQIKQQRKKELYWALRKKQWKLIENWLREWRGESPLYKDKKLPEEEYKEIVAYIERGKKYFEENPDKYEQ